MPRSQSDFKGKIGGGFAVSGK